MSSLKPVQSMKRARSTPPLSSAAAVVLPDSLHKNNQPKTPPISAKRPKPPCHPPEWFPLNLSQPELSLPLTLPTGQTFRWKQTAPSQFTGTIGSHLVSLKHQQDGDVYYCIHRTSSQSSARLALLNFLNASISLTELWAEFSASDPRFSELARHLQGARVLRQDPIECLLQFLCSSNNNIRRITKMVDFLSSLGNYLGTVGEFGFHEFPCLERLSMVSEEELREAGFGYRYFLISMFISLMFAAASLSG